MQRIPTYPLRRFAPGPGAPGVFFIDHGTAADGPPLGVPYRGDYYKIGLCLRGSAELKANLETYAIGPGSLMLVTPHTLKEWTYLSADYDGLSVFFTRDFLTAHRHLDVRQFAFLESVGTHVLALSAAAQAELQASLEFLRQKYQAPHPYRDTLIKNLLNNLLCEVEALYDQQRAAQYASQPRAQLLTTEFKHLLSRHSAAERRVQFYAAQLCITPKHLTETVKDTTGKTAGEWIAAAVLLEAQALLQNQQLSVAQVADLLHFADQSAFSRFFRKNHGLSPTAYKQAC